MGDGTKISFWHDQWCREAALKVAFPVLFGLAYAKDASIAVYLEFLGGSNKWNVSFARATQNWEVDVFVSFYWVLHSIIVRGGCEDQLWWSSSKKYLFKVKFYFCSMPTLFNKFLLTYQKKNFAQWFLLLGAASLERVFGGHRLL